MSLSADIMQAVADTCGLDELAPVGVAQMTALISRLEALEPSRPVVSTAVVRAALRLGVARSGAGAQRFADIATEDAVQLLSVHGLYADATDLEMASALGLSAARVRELRTDFDRSRKVRSMVAQARAIAMETGYEGAPSELVALALAEYAERHRSPVEARSASGGPSPRTQAGARHSAPARGGNQDVERTVVLGNDGGARRRDAVNAFPCGVAASAANGQTHVGSVRTDMGGPSTSPRPDLSYPLARRVTA